MAALFDQILANCPLLDRGESAFKVVDGTASVIVLPEMVSHRKGEGPIRFGLPGGNASENVDLDGLSDHFPVGIVVTEG
jgi:hypothetical protein